MMMMVVDAAPVMVMVMMMMMMRRGLVPVRAHARHVAHHLVDELPPRGPAEHLLAARSLLTLRLDLAAVLRRTALAAMQPPHRVLSLLLLHALRVPRVVPGVLLAARRVGIAMDLLLLLQLFRTSPRHPTASVLKRIPRQCKGALEPRSGAARPRVFNLFLHAQLTLGYRFHHRRATIRSRGVVVHLPRARTPSLARSLARSLVRARACPRDRSGACRRSRLNRRGDAHITFRRCFRSRRGLPRRSWRSDGNAERHDTTHARRLTRSRGSATSRTSL